MTQQGTDQGVLISQAALSALMPLHILIDQHGKVLGAGAIGQKFLPQGTTELEQALQLTRLSGDAPMLCNLHQAALTGERIEMRLRHAPQVKLRGHVAQTENQDLLLNFGFGMFLHEAVSKLELNDGDFPPSSQVMEYMFLYEANRGVMRELSLFNQRLKNARAMAEAQAHTDALTGVQNRRGLLLMLEAALAEIADTGNEACLAIAQLDLDHFKPVNDRLGHAAGDMVLRHTAKVLRDVTRSQDTVARIGGDEFVLILRHINNLETLENLGTRIIQGIEKPVEFDGEICRVSASIGIVLVKGTDDLQIEKILADADAALYHSKGAGRRKTTVISASMASKEKNDK